MKKSIKLTLFSLINAISLLATPVFATDEVCNSDKVPDEVKQAAGCPNTESLPALENVIINIINGVLAICGLIAVVVIVIGGIQYMTSTGDSNKTKQAKNTILYACIGLVICALAYAIVNFTIHMIYN